jgi:outer membrane protein assembly factor BamB
MFVISLFYGSSLIAESPENDWPKFMGPTADGVWNEENLISKFPEDGANIEWRVAIGAGYSGPAVASGRVFITDRTQDEGKGKEVENAIRDAGQVAGGERVLCLDAKTGDEIWSYSYDCPYRIAYPTGPRSTPTVDGDHVYTLGAMGRLICFSTSDGSVVWQKELTIDYNTKTPPWGYSSHPLIVDDTLFVAVGGEGSGIVAFDKTTGKELWKSVTTFDIAYAPLVMYDREKERQLIFWHADSVDSLNPKTGEV